MALLMAGAVLAGCSTLDESGSGEKSGGGGTNSSTETSAQPRPKAVLASPDASLLKTQKGTLTSDGVRVTNLLVGRDMPGLAFSLDIVRGQVLRQRAWSGGGELTLTPKLVSSTSKIVGVSLNASGKGGARTAIVYYDTQTNRSFASPALIAPTKWAQFTKLVAEQAGDKAEEATQALAKPTWPNGNGPAIGFSAEGDAVVTFQGGTIPAVALAGKDVAGLLSELGTRARAGAQYPTATSTPAKFVPFSPALVGKASGKDPRPQLTLGVDCRVKKCAAITFDDGPVPQTQDLLDSLNQLKAPATFFVLGTSADQFPAMVTKTAVNGMEMGSHNQNHNQMNLMGEEKLNQEVGTSRKNLRRLTGQDPLFLRPPYGAHNKRVDQVLGKNGVAVALWSVDTLDWKVSGSDPASAQSGILGHLNSEASNGAVVLMHDIHANSRSAAPAVVKALRDDGYTLVTLAELAPDTYRFGRPFCTSPQVLADCGI